ncbi:MAG: prolyl oligopeptidase family serine peptidase [Clostridiaceae bacterium]|nr:prolyl oligopeptidase family serine peptidase [Clostridiaceae bacterium]
MERVISYDTLRFFAYSNDKICSFPIKGIVLDFFGLGGQQMFNDDTQMGKELAKEGILLLIPYNNPWAWMNAQAVRYTDEIVNTIIDKYSLDEKVPIVSSGGSMGGLSALIYTRYAEHTPVACIANCPVCDLPYHYTERPDLPRTLYSAFYYSAADNIDEAMKAASPLHLVNEMPDVDYYIFHCENDSSVNIKRHSERFVSEMQKRHRIRYYTVPGRDHCDLDEKSKKLYNDYMVNAIIVCSDKPRR